MNLPAPAPARMRRLILGCAVLLALLALIALHASLAQAQRTPAPPGQIGRAVLKAILEPYFASKDGKDPLQDPDFRREMRVQWRLSTEAKYFYLVRKLALPPDLTERLYDLLVDQIFESLDNPIYSVNTPAYQSLKRKQDRELAQLIGEPLLTQLHEYEETFAYRNEVARLQVHFAGGIDVLRDDQVDAMIAILRDADDEMERARPSSADLAELRRQHDARIVEAAATALNPAQHAALDASFQREHAHWELMDIAREIVPVGASAVARNPHAVTGYFLVGTNDDRLVQNPEYRRAWHKEKRLEVESTYVDVPHVLELSPELTDRLFSLLVTQQLTRVENPTNSVSGYEDRLRHEESELKTLLGDSSYAGFLEFQNSYTQRHLVKQLQVAIGAGADSLREDQVEKLISILRDADEEMQRADPASNSFFMTKAMRQRQLELCRQRDAGIREKAAPLLTPRQFAALDAWIRWDLAP